MKKNLYPDFPSFSIPKPPYFRREMLMSRRHSSNCKYASIKRIISEVIRTKNAKGFRKGEI